MKQFKSGPLLVPLLTLVSCLLLTPPARAQGETVDVPYEFQLVRHTGKSTAGVWGSTLNNSTSFLVEDPFSGLFEIRLLWNPPVNWYPNPASRPTATFQLTSSMDYFFDISNFQQPSWACLDLMNENPRLTYDPVCYWGPHMRRGMRVNTVSLPLLLGDNLLRYDGTLRVWGFRGIPGPVFREGIVVGAAELSISGQIINPTGTVTVFLAAPEPSALPLALLGIGLVLVARRRAKGAKTSQ